MLYVVLDESNLCNKFKIRLLPKLRASIPDINTLSVDEAKQGILKDYLAWFPLIVSDIEGDIDVFGSIKEDDWTSDILVRPDPNYAKYSDKDVIDWYLQKKDTVKQAQSGTEHTTQAQSVNVIDFNEVIKITADICSAVFNERSNGDTNKLYDLCVDVQRLSNLFKDNK